MPPKKNLVAKYNDEGDLLCKCGIVANQFTVKKETVNKGRVFYSCPKNSADRTNCKTFLWADELDLTVGVKPLKRKVKAVISDDEEDDEDGKEIIESRERKVRTYSDFAGAVIRDGERHVDYMAKRGGEDYLLPNKFEITPTDRKTRSSSRQQLEDSPIPLTPASSPIKKKPKLEEEYQPIAGPSSSQNLEWTGDQSYLMMDFLKKESERKDGLLAASKKREDNYQREIKLLKMEVEVKTQRIQMLQEELDQIQVA